MSKTKYQKNNLHRILMTGARYKIQESQKTWPDASGIYAIKNTVTGKSYIGSAISFKSRWKTHRTLLRGVAPGPKAGRGLKLYGNKNENVCNC